jgi:hypothetical protein
MNEFDATGLTDRLKQAITAGRDDPARARVLCAGSRSSRVDALGKRSRQHIDGTATETVLMARTDLHHAVDLMVSDGSEMHLVTVTVIRGTMKSTLVEATPRAVQVDFGTLSYHCQDHDLARQVEALAAEFEAREIARLMTKLGGGHV